MAKEKLRVGAIVEDSSQPEYLLDVLNKSKSSTNIDIVVFFVNTPYATNRKINHLKKGIVFIIRRLFFKVIEGVELLVIKYLFPKYHIKQVNLSEFQIHKEHLKPDISSSGIVYRYNENCLNKIRKFNLDVLLRFGNGILKGDILSVCKFGVISYHHGDNYFFRGSYPGFWEVYERKDSTGFVIQKLTNELDGGEVLFKGKIATASFYLLNQNRIFKKSIVFLIDILERLSENREVHVISMSKPYYRKLYRLPTVTEQFKYVFTTYYRIIIKLLSRIIGARAKWGISILKVNDWRESVFWKSKKVIPPNGSWLADPFIFEKNNSVYLFVEEYIIKRKRAVISVYDITNYPIFKRIGIAVEEAFHLSFPYIFEFGQDIYMIPETSDNNDIRLYKSVEFPQKWELVGILMENVSAVDTFIHWDGNLFWMFTNIDSAGIKENSSELHLFYSDDLFSSNWTAHCLNPVVFDSNSARNGGFFVFNGILHRVGQSQGFDLYGKSMSVYQIKLLTKLNYVEEKLVNIEPSFLPNIRGTHTLTVSNGFVGIDFLYK